MKVALYTRVSTPKQFDTPQLLRLNEWVSQGKHETILHERDIASGKLNRRPGQERIMAEARGHHIEAVAVVKIDRWARSIQHLSQTVNELHALGIEFHAVDQGLAVRPRDPTSKLILNVLGAVAEWEGSIISERTRDSLAAIKAGGRKLGRPIGAKDKAPRKRGSKPTGGKTPESTPLPPVAINERLLDGQTPSLPVSVNTRNPGEAV